MNAVLFMLGLLTSVAYLPGSLDAPLVGRWVVLTLGVAFCLLLLSRVDRFPRLVALVVALAGVSILWSPDRLEGVDDLSHLVALGAAFWLGASLFSLLPMWLGLAAGVSISALLAVPQFFGVEIVPEAASPSGLFSNRNFLAEACMVGLIACLSMNRWKPIAFILGIGILIAASKAVFVALVIIWALSIAPRRPAIAWSALGLISLSLIVALLAGGTSIPSVAARLVIWEPALSNLTWTGHGLGSFASTYPVAEFAHNEPLQAVYELGIFAVIPMMIFISVLWSSRRDTSTEFLILVAIGVVSLFSFPFHLPVTALAAAMAAGTLAGRRNRLVESRDLVRTPLAVGA